MATKKQKRAEGERKQEINRKESIRTGLLAIKKDRERKDRIAKDLARKAEREQNRADAKSHWDD